MPDEPDPSDGPENLTLRLLRRMDERIQRIDGRVERIDERVDRMEADIAVLTAIALRQDVTFGAMLTELRAMHSQHSRLVNRVRALEEAKP